MLEKGTYGYIHRQKKRKITGIVLIFFLAVGIYLAGLFLNKMEQANIFTVFAILCVLPWAKQVVGLVVLFPYHSVSGERYEKMQKQVVCRKETEKLYADLVITSPDKVMNLDFLFLGTGYVVALVGKKGQDISYIRQYLSHGVHQWGDFSVKVVESEKMFVAEANKPGKDPVDTEEIHRVDSYLRSLMV
jgi:hypothetical protein